jgi:hypothetical protein
METVLNHTQDMILTQRLIEQAGAQTAAANSLALRHKAIGTGAILGGGALVVLALGGGLAMMIYAWNHRTATADELKAALADLPPVKVETTLKEGVVKLADGGKVTLADGGRVGVDGTVKIENPTVKLDTSSFDVSKFMDKSVKSSPDKDINGNVITSKLTVFFDSPLAPGKVTSGWTYSRGDSTTPDRKFCYYQVSKTDGSGGSEMFDLATNGIPDQQGIGHAPAGALNLCKWS